MINDLNQRVVVTSHIYVQGAKAEDGCGCATGDASDGLVVVLVAFALGRRRYKRPTRMSLSPSSS